MLPDSYSKILKLPTLKLAKRLLGMKLSTIHKNIITSGMIVEVEAYHGKTDLACHAYYKRTKRNEIMFAESGHCYVYFIYGMYHCVNIVTEDEGTGAAVLIRAVEPLDGVNIMAERRKFKGTKIYNLTNGPGKLCIAMGIDRKLSGIFIPDSDKIILSKHKKILNKNIIETTRIGISKSKELPWRFYIKDNPWVSKAS